MKTWARLQLAPYEGVLLEHTPWRVRIAATILYPRFLSWHLGRLAPWPGDRWGCVVRDKVGIVRKVRRDGVVLAVASGQLMANYGCGWDFESAAPVTALEFVRWTDLHWGPA